MKKSILLAVLLMFAVPMVAGAETVTSSNEKHYKHSVTVHDKTTAEDLREEFDYGAYLDLVLWQSEDGKFELGNKNTYTFEREEFTTLFGGKVNVWSIFKNSKSNQ